MSLALSYLTSREWSAGNGQCPECWGLTDDKTICDWHHEDEKYWRLLPDLFEDHPEKRVHRTLGHEKDCHLKAAIDECIEADKL